MSTERHIKKWNSDIRMIENSLHTLQEKVKDKKLKEKIADIAADLYNLKHDMGAHLLIRNLRPWWKFWG